jgi:hypothetical protein
MRMSIVIPDVPHRLALDKWDSPGRFVVTSDGVNRILSLRDTQSVSSEAHEATACPSVATQTRSRPPCFAR